MAHQPDYLAQRRRAQTRRRRAIAATALALVLCVAGVSIYLLNQTHHRIVVVRVTTPAAPPSKAATPTHAEYPVAPGAPSEKSVREALAATQHQHAGNTETSSTASGSLFASDATSSFRDLASSLPGRIELAATPLGAGQSEVLGNDEAAHGWSTTKVPVLVSLLRARGSAGLTSQEQAWAQSAITE